MIYYKKKIQQDVGATAVEYGILSALIAVVTILSLQATGTNLGTTYCTIANQLSQATGAGATASGCSATSSSSSSSSSADSSGSSADSSSSSSSDSSADGSGSDSSASVSTPAVYDASNSYTPGNNLFSNLNTLMNTNITGMTGIYDSDGNELTTPEQLANAIGVSDADYQTLENVYNGTNPDYNSYNMNDSTDAKAYSKAWGCSKAAQAQIENDIASDSSANFYIPDLSQVTMTGTVDKATQTATFTNESAAVPTIYTFKNSTGSLWSYLTLNKPTGD